MLLPVDFEYTTGFTDHHECDPDFPWKALYAFPQAISWLNLKNAGGKIRFGWFVFERGYQGEVLRQKIRFFRNKQ